MGSRDKSRLCDASLRGSCRLTIQIQIQGSRDEVPHKMAVFYVITRSSAIAVIADRTACSILTLFIVTATSRPPNKKLRLLSIRGSKNYCGSASAIRSPQSAHLCLHLHHKKTNWHALETCGTCSRRQGY